MDAEVLSDSQTNALYGFTFIPTIGKKSHCVFLNESFEQFQVCFTVNFPDDMLHDNMTLTSYSEMFKSAEMIKPPEFLEWMPIKYGEPKKPFKHTVTYENTKSGIDGQWAAD